MLNSFVKLLSIIFAKRHLVDIWKSKYSRRSLKSFSAPTELFRILSCTKWASAELRFDSWVKVVNYWAWLVIALGDWLIVPEICLCHWLWQWNASRYYFLWFSLFKGTYHISQNVMKFKKPGEILIMPCLLQLPPQETSGGWRDQI